jgi:GT2 family glycosyltransferase
MPRVFIIVVNYNGPDDTLECIASVRKINYPDYRVVLVDNGSTDASIEVFRKNSSDITLIENGENLGFAEGNNVGIRHALANGADYVFLLNNDTVLEPDALGHLVSYAQENPAAGIVGPKILYYSNPDTIWFAGGNIDPFNGASHIGNGNQDDGTFDEIRQVGYITGCALLARRDMMEDVGLMDPEYFLLYEESDWCLRAARKGYLCYYVPEARVYHKCSKTFGGQRTPLWVYYYVRNSFLIIRRNLIFPLSWIAYMKCFIRSLRWIDWRRRHQLARRTMAVGAGIYDFMRGRFGRKV